MSPWVKMELTAIGALPGAGYVTPAIVIREYSRQAREGSLTPDGRRDVVFTTDPVGTISDSRKSELRKLNEDAGGMKAAAAAEDAMFSDSTPRAVPSSGGDFSRLSSAEKARLDRLNFENPGR
jgi:hypothetical protein